MFYVHLKLHYRPSLHNGHFLGRRVIYWLLFKPLNNGHLSPMAIFWADKSFIDSYLNLSTTATSLQWSLSSAPKVVIMDRFNYTFGRVFTFRFLNVSLHVHCSIADSLPFSLFLPFKNCSSNKMSQLTKENKTVKITNYRDLPKQRLLVQVSDVEEKELRTHNSEAEWT